MTKLKYSRKYSTYSTFFSSIRHIELLQFYWLHLRTQSDARSSFLLLWPQFRSHACPSHIFFINLTSQTKRICTKIDNVWFQKISIPPPPHGRDLPYDPPSLWIFQNPPSKFTHLPSGISKIFAHPLEILLSLIEVNKEVVLFPRMPNFVSFVYFLLNCITDKRIPYANSLCAQVTDKFCAFHVISIEFYNSANEMQGRVGNITVLFSHCVKKKASLEEV